MNNIEIPAPREAAARSSVEARVRQVFDRNFDLVWKFVRRMGVPSALVDDAVQEVFLVTSRRIDGVQEGREKAYLIGVALRVCSHFRRSERRRRTTPEEPAVLDVADMGSLDPDEALDLLRARSVLDDVLDEMPGEVRAVFILSELEQMTLQEIANVLHAPLGTIKTRLRRARELFDERAERHRRVELGKERHG